jgi:hypothetical protein
VAVIFHASRDSLTRLRRPADKFKVFRIRFIFYFKIVFIKNFLKMAPIRVCFSPGFLQEQDFLGSNLIRADHVGKKTSFSRSKLLQCGTRSTPEHSSPDCEPARAASVENSPRKGAPLEF